MKLKILILLFFYYSFSNLLNAQITIDSSFFEQSKEINITNKLIYFRDTSTLQVNSVIKIDASKWNPIIQKAFISNIPNSVFWFRFDLINFETNQKPLFLKLSNKAINKVMLYTLYEGKIIKVDSTGDYYAFNTRPYPAEQFIFPLKIEKNNKYTFLLYCDKKNENLNVELKLVNAKELREQEFNLYFFIGLFFGFLSLGIITNFVLYLILRNKLHFWYGLYILSIINFISAYESFDFRWVYPNYPFYANISRYNASSISLALICVVMQIVCDQSKFNSRFYRITNYIKYSILLNLLLSFVVFNYFPQPLFKKIYFYYFLLTQILGIIIILISCFEKILQGYKPALFYFLAVFFLLCTGYLAIYSELHFIDINKETPNLLQFGFVLEVVLISIAIMYKFYLIRKEYKTIQNELQDLKLSGLKELLKIQHNERSRIAEDIHDILGSHLAAIKIDIEKSIIKSEYKENFIISINEISEKARRIINNLIPEELVNYDLSYVLMKHISNLNVKQKIFFSFNTIGNPSKISKSTEYVIYKTILELVNNILKHSSASEALIQIFFNEDGSIQIVIEDNGIGINNHSRKGIGLASIDKRIKELDGSFFIDSNKDYTTVIINIPQNSL